MREEFEKLYGRNLIGEHTDYNGGFVLPMAIDRCTQIAAAPNGSSRITIRSTAVDSMLEIDLAQPIEPGPQSDWANYPKGVVAGFLDADYPVRGFDALIHSTLPLGAGLSSSASLEVALATLLEVAAGIRIDPVRKAELCRKAEHAYAKVPCGIMDQFASALAREHYLLLLDCGSLVPEWIELPDPSISVLIVQTNVRHQHAGGEYAIRRQQCEAAARALGIPLLRQSTREQLERARDTMDETTFRRALHVVTESTRTWHASRAILARNWPETGRLMYESHDSLRDDFEVSCAELDAVVGIARKIGIEGGVYGCRMTGGGFGGCAVALIETAQRDVISHTLEKEYLQMTGIQPHLFTSRPAAGARVMWSA